MNNPTAPVPGKSLAEMIGEASMLEQNIVALAESNGGEIDAMLEGYLEQINKDIETKTDSYKFVMERLEMSAAVLKGQADQIYAAASSLMKARDNMKSRIKLALLQLGKEEVRGVNWRFKLSQIAPKMEVDMKQLEREYYDQASLSLSFPIAVWEEFCTRLSETKSTSQVADVLEVFAAKTSFFGKPDKDKILQAVKDNIEVLGVTTEPNYQLRSYVNKKD